jgi:CDP-diacylglycerol---glycerol-3-phosphate 3-phosphatidyltransferase
MANLITLARLLLLFLVLGLAYVDHLAAQISALLLLIIVFIMDGLDGWVARRRGESSLFGSVFDIAADRVVENMLWVVLAHLHRVPVWVPLVFLARGFLVDSIRSVGVSRQETPFGMMKSSLGRFLVSGRLMRGLYGVIKTTAFIWLFMLPVLGQIAPAFALDWQDALSTIAWLLVVGAVALCLIRGIPVVVEFLIRERVLPWQSRHA